MIKEKGPPPCTFCGNNHFPKEPHIWTDGPKDTPRDQARKGGKVMPAATSSREGGQGARSPVAASVDPILKGHQASEQTLKPDAPFDRNAYQRAYMRKWRAAQKVKP